MAEQPQLVTLELMQSWEDASPQGYWLIPAGYWLFKAEASKIGSRVDASDGQ